VLNLLVTRKEIKQGRYKTNHFQFRALPPQRHDS